MNAFECVVGLFLVAVIVAGLMTAFGLMNLAYGL